MGKRHAAPRYHVLSCRANELEMEEIEAVIGGGNRSEYVRQAVIEKVRRDRQRQVDSVLLR